MPSWVLADSNGSCQKQVGQEGIAFLLCGTDTGSWSQEGVCLKSGCAAWQDPRTSHCNLEVTFCSAENILFSLNILLTCRIAGVQIEQVFPRRE